MAYIYQREHVRDMSTLCVHTDDVLQGLADSLLILLPMWHVWSGHRDL